MDGAPFPILLVDDDRMDADSEVTAEYVLKDTTALMSPPEDLSTLVMIELDRVSSPGLILCPLSLSQGVRAEEQRMINTSVNILALGLLIYARNQG
jgi:hypothetical protein